MSNDNYGIKITGGYKKKWGQQDENGELKPEIQFFTFRTQADVDTFINNVVPKITVGSRFVADPTPASFKEKNPNSPDYQLKLETTEVVARRTQKKARTNNEASILD